MSLADISSRLMDKNEVAQLTQVVTDVEWIKREVPKSLDEVLKEVRGIVGRQDAVEKRVTLTEQSGLDTKLRMSDHLVDDAREKKEMLLEIRENTKFRENAEALVKFGKWLIPSNVIISVLSALTFLYITITSATK